MVCGRERGRGWLLGERRSVDKVGHRMRNQGLVVRVAVLRALPRVLEECCSDLGMTMGSLRPSVLCVTQPAGRARGALNAILIPPNLHRVGLSKFVHLDISKSNYVCSHSTNPVST